MAAGLQATSQDIDTPDGLHLRQVVDEYSCLHTVAARVDPAGHMALLANAQNAFVAGSTSAPNYREAVVMLLQACKTHTSHDCAQLVQLCMLICSRCIVSAASSHVDAGSHTIPVALSARLVHKKLAIAQQLAAFDVYTA